MLNLDDDERVSDILPVEEFSEDKFIFMATRKGITKKTNLSHFARKWKSGIKAINLDEDDRLIGTAITDGTNEILLASSSGKLIRFQARIIKFCFNVASFGYFRVEFWNLMRNPEAHPEHSPLPLHNPARIGPSRPRDH